MTVPLRVILDRMAAPHDLAGEIGIAQDAFAHAKKTDAGAVRIELRKYLRGDLRVGSVIDGDRHLAALDTSRRQPCPVRTQQPASRPQARRGQHYVIEQ